MVYRAFSSDSMGRRHGCHPAKAQVFWPAVYPRTQVLRGPILLAKSSVPGHPRVSYGRNIAEGGELPLGGGGQWRNHSGVFVIERWIIELSMS